MNLRVCCWLSVYKLLSVPLHAQEMKLDLSLLSDERFCSLLLLMEMVFPGQRCPQSGEPQIELNNAHLHVRQTVQCCMDCHSIDCVHVCQVLITTQWEDGRCIGRSTCRWRFERNAQHEGSPAADERGKSERNTHRITIWVQCLLTTDPTEVPVLHHLLVG